MSSDERYYVVEANNGGMYYSPTTCRALAEDLAARCDREYPSCAPHRVLQLVPAVELIEARRMYCESLAETTIYAEKYEIAAAQGWDPAELWP